MRGGAGAGGGGGGGAGYYRGGWTRKWFAAHVDTLILPYRSAFPMLKLLAAAAAAAFRRALALPRRRAEPSGSEAVSGAAAARWCESSFGVILII